MKRIILASASALALFAVPAQAQETPAAEAPATPPADAPPAASPTNANEVEEIVITAQRTSESAQKAPIAVTVISPDELVQQNVTRPEDLARVAPALVGTNNGGANTTFFLRGVGNFTNNSYSDPAIAFNYDGVYIGRPTNAQGLFYDLQRVEVLKGPQGTLYGRNATGGAINVIPARPQLGQNSGEIVASYGNYDAVQAQGSVNIALGAKQAIRVAGMLARHDGYLSDGTSDQKTYGLRGQYLAEFTPDLTTRFAFDYAHDGGVGKGAYQYGTTFFNGVDFSFARAPGLGPSIGVLDPRTNAFFTQQFIASVGRRADDLNTRPYQDNDYWGVLNETNWTSSAGTLTVVSAYRDGKIDSLSTAAQFRGFLTQEKNQQATFEARFAGKLGPVDYLVGGYYFDEDIDASLVINQIVSIPFQDYRTGTKSKAMFGRLSWNVTPDLTLTAAARYTHDRKTFRGLSNVYTVNCGNPIPPQDNCPTFPLIPLVGSAAELIAFYTSQGIPVGNNGVNPPPIFNRPRVLNTRIPIDAATTTSKITYRLAADWQVTPDSMVYASYETGFRGGGFSFARGLEAYNPETIAAWTLGSKNRFFDRRLQLNIEAFYWKYKDQQFSQFGADLGTPPAQVFYTSNVGKSTIKGIDIDMVARVTPTTRVSGSIQYLKSKYDEFITYAPNMGTIAAPGRAPNYNCPFRPVIFNGANSFELDCSGKVGFNAPKWSFSGYVDQTINLENYKVVLQGGTRYRSKQFVSATYQPWLISPGAFMSDASITFAPNSDRWFISAYVNNIEDKRRLVVATTNQGIGTLSGITSDPRTYGVRVGGKF